MPENPQVSVIMTVYNGESHLAQAIESIQRQTLTNFEFIIVDDGSTDETPQILTRYQADPRIKVITKPRLGRGKALNVAWRAASCNYIANLDADDLAEPKRLEMQMDFLTQHPTVGLLNTGCKFVYEGTDKEKIVTSTFTTETLPRELIRRNPITHSSVMMQRHALSAVGGYNESLPVSIDYDLWVRLADKYPVSNLPEVLTVRKLRQQSYFHSKKLNWQRYKAHLEIRWRAWHQFSQRIEELRFVIGPPTKQLLNSYFYTVLHRTSSEKYE